MTQKYKLAGHEPVPCTLMEWAEWFEGGNRIVEQTDVNPDVRVSTVFFGLDHQFGDGPPLLFETMIFGGPHDQYQERFSTWDQAESGHRAALKLAITP
jgi:hypothetical protein